MINKCKTLIILVICASFVLSGCTNSANTIGLNQVQIQSNKKQEDISKILKEFLQPGAEFITLKKEDHKESIFVEDIDQDGKQEAFVLYRDTKENKQVHLLVLKEEGEKWKILSDTATGFNTLDYFKLKDLEGNNNKELILGVSAGDSEVKKELFIYEWHKSNLVKTVNRSYEGIDIADYNGDKKPDLLIVDGERNKLQTAQLFSYEKGQLKVLSSVELNPDSFHENIVFGKLADGKKALYIDGGLGAHSMLTEIVAYNNGKLIKVGKEDDGTLFKAYPLYSRDINNDGVVEVGGMYITKGFEDAAMAEIPFIYTYSDYRIDGSKQIIEERYTDNCKKFYITIPPKLYGKVTVKKLDNGVSLISNLDEKTLFKVKWINKESYVASNTKLKETKDTVFYTDTKEDLSIPNDNFHLLQDEF
ncbi:hypothetical protein JK636_04570 [Clostridium sp. YIM B02515]|uniref:VCBS repeat-containing protein n=1 Tax=Clostridium rhizosphaerae TaxID=2803861 RepID=A0ABS1T9K3_9CLOT|nr:hypothetical protein [Clostridium rhizosphaerae]MBL4935029.1 hypothetical protein [Clostridium rhizosphaerae]